MLLGGVGVVDRVADHHRSIVGTVEPIEVEAEVGGLLAAGRAGAPLDVGEVVSDAEERRPLGELVVGCHRQQ